MDEARLPSSSAVKRLHPRAGPNQGHSPRMFNMRNLSMIASVAAMLVAGSASASTYLTMTQAANPSDTSWTTTTGSAFTSEFNYQSTGNKLRLWDRLGSSSAPTTVVNPGSEYWGPSSGNPAAPRPQRSWEVIWNNATGSMTTRIYDTTDWTGAASADLSMTLPNTLFGGQADAGGDFILRGVAQFATGALQNSGSFYWRVNARVDNGTNNLTGINFLVAPTGGGVDASIVLSDIQFNGGNGFVSVAGVNGTYVAPNSNNFYNLAVVPAPGALALLGAAGLLGGRRRRA